ncbi:MAG: radical SAM/SPASM domain-containing protein [Lachnotalea sp.]
MGLMDKPDVVKRIHNYTRIIRKNDNKVGKVPRTLALDYNNICNFKCEFCYEKEDYKYNLVSLDFETITRVADQAYELGIWEIILQGGELLINKEILLKIIKAIKPERFRMILVTNGYLLTQEYADELAKRGLDCIGISISGMDAQEFDRSRGVKGAHEKVFTSIEYAKNAGMTTWLQPIFGHHNSHSKDLFDLLDYAKGHNISVYFILAMPYGVWKDNYLDAEDIRIFNKIRKEYKSWYDTWDFYDPKKERISGCWAMNRIFVTPKGDVLPCPFINITMGNVKEKTLSEILDYGFSIKYFGEYSPVCIAAQNRSFREKYLGGSTSLFEPAKAKEVFSDIDFI